MDTLANSEDPVEMLHYGAFHRGLHCFLRQNRFQKKSTIVF